MQKGQCKYVNGTLSGEKVKIKLDTGVEASIVSLDHVNVKIEKK